MRKNLTVCRVLPTQFPARSPPPSPGRHHPLDLDGDRILAVAGTYPLHEITAAHEAVERGDKAGTVVVEV